MGLCACAHSRPFVCTLSQESADAETNSPLTRSVRLYGLARWR